MDQNRQLNTKIRPTDKRFHTEQFFFVQKETKAAKLRARQLHVKFDIQHGT